MALSAPASVAYLSGAPRLSTRDDTESLGPRSHMLGVISALEQEGFSVTEYIAGNDVPRRYGGEGSEKLLSSSVAMAVVADLLRLYYRWRSRLRVARRLGGTSFAFSYERYALFQELGSVLQRRGVPWVLEVNAVLSEEAVGARRATFSGRVATWSERRTLRRADIVVAVTEALRLELLSRYELDASRVLVAENGVDPERFRDPDPWTEEEQQTIGFLGALYPWQRVDLLIEALPTFPRVHLDVAGEGVAREDLEMLSQRLGVANRVKFLGRLSPTEVPRFLSECDLVYAGHHLDDAAVYFSPLKLWEYLAAGRPVLASRHATTQDLATRGFAVVCFDPRSPQDLHDALGSALDQLPPLVALAEKQREAASEQFSWRARLAPVFDSALGLRHSTIGAKA